MYSNYSQLKSLRWLLWCILIITACSSSEAQTVYITKTGAKYHDGGCRYLSRSKIAIEIKDAIDQGYTPCSVCDPDSKIEEEQDVVRQPQGQAPPNAQQNKTTVKKNTATSSQCSAYTKAGARCKRAASTNGKCWQHQ